MTRFIHDKFAKDYLEELLTPFGTVQAPRSVTAEVREIDVWFEPAPISERNPEVLGLLGRLAATPCIFEPFRNPATAQQICDCLSKELELRRKYYRETSRNLTENADSVLPRLWILTPTASVALLSGFRAILEPEWLPGVYLMAPELRTAIYRHSPIAPYLRNTVVEDSGQRQCSEGGDRGNRSTSSVASIPNKCFNYAQ